MPAQVLLSENAATDMSAIIMSHSSHNTKPQRVLSCILCQQRKVKCDRKFPCANCVKSRAQCVPATLTQRRRRRRFSERELLDRLRTYENLLRQKNIPFESLHETTVRDKVVLNAGSDHESQEENTEHGTTSTPDPLASTKTGNDFVAKNIWHAMNRGFREAGDDSDSSHDDIRENSVQKALDQTMVDENHLLFGPSHTDVDLSYLHPNAVQLFRLWQIYLDNINPLLKITHTPSLQGQIIEAASNIATIVPELEALMFGIYCTAVMTLTADDCQIMFSSSREDLLHRFRTGCQQALWKSQFLRTDNRDCLTALYLYLISIRTTLLPQSLSSVLGVAIRTAQRMGIHRESVLSKFNPLEAEMRRRLWWSLVLFDARVGEMANWKTSTLDPTWDCNIPLNLNDSDLHTDMKRPPVAHGQGSEALFIAVRSELADFVRHASFHLDFTNPVLKSVSRNYRNSASSGERDITKFEERIESQFLRSCNHENPIQFMTLWTTRALLARYQLLEYHSRASQPSVQQIEAQRDVATTHALRMLECDTKIMTSPLTKGFTWLNHLYFPFVAYNHIVQDLKRRPLWEAAQQCWAVMSENHQAWFDSRFRDVDNPVLRMFADMILRGWEACEAAYRETETSVTTPDIVVSTRRLLAQRAQHEQASGTDEVTDSFGRPAASTLASPSMDYNMQEVPFTIASQEEYAMGTQGAFRPVPGHDSMSGLAYQWNSTFMGGWPGWGGY